MTDHILQGLCQAEKDDVYQSFNLHHPFSAENCTDEAIRDDGPSRQHLS
jgi:hypothetical protein